MAQTTIACLRKDSAQRLDISGGLALGHATMPLLVLQQFAHYCTCRGSTCLHATVADKAQQVAKEFGA